MTEKLLDKENVKGYSFHNYKMKYAKSKRGFWLIVDYRKQQFFGFIDERLLGQGIQDHKTAETIEAVIDELTEKILKKYGSEVQKRVARPENYLVEKMYTTRTN